MRNHTVEVCATFQMHLSWYGECPSSWLPCVQHKLPPTYCVSIGPRAVHGGFMHRCPPIHGYPTQLHIGNLLRLRNGSLCTECVLQGLLILFLNNLTSVHWVSIGLTGMHGGFMHCCPSMHGYPPWVTTHWKSDPPFTCIWMGRGMALALFIMCLAWVATCSLGFKRGHSCTLGFHAQVSAHAWRSSMRNQILEVCPAFQLHLGG